jgi:hypothetical protein
MLRRALFVQVLMLLSPGSLVSRSCQSVSVCKFTICNCTIFDPVGGYLGDAAIGA